MCEFTRDQLITSQTEKQDSPIDGEKIDKFKGQDELCMKLNLARNKIFVDDFDAFCRCDSVLRILLLFKLSNCMDGKTIGTHLIEIELK